MALVTDPLRNFPPGRTSKSIRRLVPRHLPCSLVLGFDISPARTSFAMRVVLALTAVFGLTPLAPAAVPTEESKERERLEKAGDRVSIDDSLPDGVRRRVTFAKVDDKAMAALRGSNHVGALTVEDAAKVTDRTLQIIGAFGGLR